MNKRTAVSAILLLSGVACFVFAVRQPEPGRYSWFHGLAGDPSVKIAGTSLEIGPSTDGSGTFDIFRWEAVSASRGRSVSSPQTVLSGVASYSSDGVWIAAKTVKGLAIIDVKTHEVHWVERRESSVLPEEALSLFAYTLTPSMSKRNPMMVIGLVLVCLASYGLLTSRRRLEIRDPADDSGHGGITGQGIKQC